MLVEKYDTHMVKPLTVINSKLTRYPSKVFKPKEDQMPEIYQLRPPRKGSLNPLEDKSHIHSEDTFGIRMPKVYSKNLPDVFLMNTPSARRAG